MGLSVMWTELQDERRCGKYSNYDPVEKPLFDCSEKSLECLHIVVTKQTTQKKLKSKQDCQSYCIILLYS